VARVLNSIRPIAQGDGGDIEFVDVDAEGVVRVRLHGACVGCPSSSMTLSLGIERNLRDQIPEVRRVVCV
jgi:Fe-S cluster biogenesis protein NfuA